MSWFDLPLGAVHHVVVVQRMMMVNGVVRRDVRLMNKLVLVEMLRLRWRRLMMGADRVIG